MNEVSKLESFQNITKFQIVLDGKMNKNEDLNFCRLFRLPALGKSDFFGRLQNLREVKNNNKNQHIPVFLSFD